MPKNIEIKARLKDQKSLRTAVESMAGRGPDRLVQVDTFFRCPKGRLKLRIPSRSGGELIYYEREDTSRPRVSRYFLAPAPDAKGLLETLAAALGVRGTVRKKRDVYRVGQTRIHLDEVEALGSFVELEVVLAEGQTPADGMAVIKGLMNRLGIEEQDLVGQAYIDLLMASAEREGS
jgi:adenylate cyclase